MLPAGFMSHKTAADPREAVADLYHAWFTGTVLSVVARRGTADASRLVFRVFRRQQELRFLPGLRKLGLDQLPPAVAAARYHYHSNAVGGVGVEFVEEGPRKAWVRYPPPRWIWPGATLCAIPGEVNAAMLRGWHANNGVMLGCLRLGFVCTGQTADGDPGLEGYYFEADHDLAPEDRLRFSRGERMPRFDPAKAPHLPEATWPVERLAKAKCNYALEYVRSLIHAAATEFGSQEGPAVVAFAGRQVGMQCGPAAVAALVPNGPTKAAELFARYLAASAIALGDAAEVSEAGPGLWRVEQAWPRFFAELSPSVGALACWTGLQTGVALALDRDLRVCRSGGSGEPQIWDIAG